MKKFVFAYLLFSQLAYAQLLPASIVNDPLMLAFHKGLEEARKIAEDVSKKVISAKVQERVSLYINLANDIICNDHDLFELYKRLKTLGVNSCLLQSEINFLTFSLGENANFITLVAQLVNTMTQTNEKPKIEAIEEQLRTYVVQLQEAQKNKAALYNKMELAENRIMKYDAMAKNFDKMYDRVYNL